MKRFELLYKPGWVWDVLPCLRVNWRPKPVPWSIELSWLCFMLIIIFRRGSGYFKFEDHEQKRGREPL